MITQETWLSSDSSFDKLSRAPDPSTSTSTSARLFDPPPALESWGPLHSGATWTGVQKSGRNSYQVKVTLETVDYGRGTMTGLLEIHGLTPDLDKLVTYFEGEIVTSHGAGFVTGKWAATEKEDLQHWARFAPFHGVKSQCSGPKMNYNHKEKPFLFMRWKEQFVLPDPKMKNIHGASFAGFYYLCLSLENEPAPAPVAPMRRLSSATRSVSTGSTMSLSPPRVPIPSRSPPPTISSLSQMLAGTSPPPMRPRSISYAAAVRGASPSPPVITVAAEEALLVSPSSTVISLPSDNGSEEHDQDAVPTHESNVKEQESDATVSAPIPINLPNGMTIDDFPVPTSPTLNSPPATSAGNVWGSSRRGRRASSSSSLLNRSSSDSPSPASAAAAKKEEPTYGMRSWTRARLTGFYYFRNSEPYQELELKYTPRNRGGSPAFEFC